MRIISTVIILILLVEASFWKRDLKSYDLTYQILECITVKQTNLANLMQSCQFCQFSHRVSSVNLYTSFPIKGVVGGGCNYTGD